MNSRLGGKDSEMSYDEDDDDDDVTSTMIGSLIPQYITLNVEINFKTILLQCIPFIKKQKQIKT